MKIAIVGPGAMGSLFAYFLADSGHEIWLIDHRPERVEKIKKEGIRIEGVSGEHHLRPRITADPKEAGIVELIIVCVKAYDTGEAIKGSFSLVGKATTVLSLQNGKGNLEIISAVVGEDRVIGGTTAQGATVLGEGHIRHAGLGETIIGSSSEPVSKSLDTVVDLFNRSGVEASKTDDLEGLIWGKLLINVGINALTALTRLKNGQLLDYPGTRRLMAEAVGEGVKVVEAKGIRLSYPDAVDKVESVARATAGNISSMLQDVLKKKRTEVDYINGAIVSEGQKLGIETPVNQSLTYLVKTLEESYDTQIWHFTEGSG
ncbi:MAG: 2-dehydropantoate 2-reductase [Deltaproteobacteria bacterium]|nr:MAG: 2-dehydropantoate 2-reductase [Deltaproteobacteria bacterium]